MGQVQSVSYFMSRFLKLRAGETLHGRGNAIELLPQPVPETSAGAAHLRFAENESENRDIKVDGADA
jgi:hypothetical protein